MRNYKSKPDKAQVCIIGSGASGATAARMLTEAGINVENDGKRKFRFFVEDRDLLRTVVLEHLKILLLEACNRGAALIGNGDEHIDELDIDLKGRVIVVAGAGVGFRGSGALGPRRFRDTRRRLRRAHDSGQEW